jgi:hypothetical protein
MLQKQKRKGNGWILLIGVFVLFGFIEYVELEKKYQVSLTNPQWGRAINHIENAKTYLINSDMPARDVKAITDSLSTFQDEIRKQVIPQLPKQQPIKKDTIPK